MRAVIVLLFVLLAGPAAGELPRDLVAADTRRVVEVIDGDTVVLDDRRQVRLVGTQAPKLPLGRRNFPTWPLAPESKAALESLAQGRLVTLHYGGERVDRNRRALAHLVREDGVWLQGEMLTRGMARVYTFPDNRAAVPEMLAREGAARAARRGIWAHPYYAVRHPEALDGLTDTFQIVEGRVLRTARAGGGVYLNFGADHRQDFTVFVPGEALRLYRAAGLDPLALAGRTIRVRGWIAARNGPLIQATHPEQIELP
ncbi:MAG: thermonuclease family protein [Thalassobaculales bacterium]